MDSSAQDSLLTAQAPSSVRPRQSGRKPFGSRKAIILVAVMTMHEYAPEIDSIVFSMASSVLAECRR